jgi:DNA-binding NarL/FixJ family response regulator
MKIKVAVFDDNKTLRNGLQLLINSSEKLSCVGVFENCLHVLEDIESTDPDIVLMDINMPYINGIEALKMVKSKFPSVKVLMQTVFEDDDKVFASLCAGASGYILKNTTPDKILQAIREVNDGGAFFTPSIAKKVLNNFQLQPGKAEYIQLTEKEKEVLKHLVDGLSYKMIADKVTVSFHTIHSHIKNIYEKLHVNSKGEAVAKAIKNKLI